MGMSTHVVGIRDMDGTFKKMMDIKKFCDEQKVSYPKEVSDYFGKLAKESEEIIEEEMLEIRLKNHASVKEYNADMSQGFEVDLSKLPEEVKIIRFYNSW